MLKIVDFSLFSFVFLGYSTSESWESKGSFLQCTGFTYYFRRWGQSGSWRISWSFWSPCGKGEWLIHDIVKVLMWVLHHYNRKYSCLDDDQMKHIFKDLLFLLCKLLSWLTSFTILFSPSSCCSVSICVGFFCFLFCFIFSRFFLQSSVRWCPISCTLEMFLMGRFLQASGNGKPQYRTTAEGFCLNTCNWQGAKWFCWFCICVLR